MRSVVLARIWCWFTGVCTICSHIVVPPAKLYDLHIEIQRLMKNAHRRQLWMLATRAGIRFPPDRWSPRRLRVFRFPSPTYLHHMMLAHMSAMQLNTQCDRIEGGSKKLCAIMNAGCMLLSPMSNYYGWYVHETKRRHGNGQKSMPRKTAKVVGKLKYNTIIRIYV